MSAWNRQQLGKWGEELAGLYLQACGFGLLATRYRKREGEIDLVAADGPTLVFVEVKSHTGRERSELTGLERMDSRKRTALRRTCALYRKKVPGSVDQYRLDLVTVEFEGDSCRRRVKQVRWYPAVLDLD